MADNRSNQPFNDEITLKELILKVQEYFWYLWGKKWWIILAGLIGGGIGFYRAWATPVTYMAELTYMVNEDEGAKLSGAATILTQFGLGSSGSEYNLDKIVALSKSRRIVQKVLLDSTVVDGNDDLVANHLVNILNLHADWANSLNLKDFYFDNNELESFNRSAKRALKIIYLKVAGGENKPGLLNSTYTESTGILRLAVTSENEDLSIALTKGIYTYLSNFYVKQSTEKQRETFQQLNAEVDSISIALSIAENKLANFQDRSQGLLSRRDALPKNTFSREVQVLAIMYGEALKNRETAAFILKNKTPFFQILDGVLEPAKVIAKSKFVSSIVSALIAMLGVGVFLMIYFVYNNIMRGFESE